MPVTEEVYREYKRPQWRETKQKKVRQMREFSLEYMTENGMEQIYSDKQKLVEEIVEDNLMLEMLHILPAAACILKQTQTALR